MLFTLRLALFALAADQPAAPTARIPPPSPGSTAITCHADEPGPRLLIAGRVVTGGNRPIAGASVTLYNTDASGLYNPRNSDTREPRIRANVVTDDQGRFQVLTVYPASYPGEQIPAHVHLVATAPSYNLRYSAIWFEGDKFVTPAEIKRMQEYTAAHPNDVTKVEKATRLPDGLARVNHTIQLEPN